MSNLVVVRYVHDSIHFGDQVVRHKPAPAINQSTNQSIMLFGVSFSLHATKQQTWHRPCTDRCLRRWFVEPSQAANPDGWGRYPAWVSAFPLLTKRKWEWMNEYRWRECDFEPRVMSMKLTKKSPCSIRKYRLIELENTSRHATVIKQRSNKSNRRRGSRCISVTMRFRRRRDEKS